MCLIYRLIAETDARSVGDSHPSWLTMFLNLNSDVVFVVVFLFILLAFFYSSETKFTCRGCIDAYDAMTQ